VPRIVIIGGVAAGTSAASQAKRRAPSAEVVLLERGPDVSYGACGIPYNIADPDRPLEDLVAVSAERFRVERGIDVRTRHEVTDIDPAARMLSVRALDGGASYTLGYDALVISTGASAQRPSLPGAQLSGVFTLRELSDGRRLKDYIAARAPQRALILGGGFIGVEMAEGLRERGIAVKILERSGQIAGGFADPVAAALNEQLARHAVDVQTGVQVSAIERVGDELVVHSDRGSLRGELVLLAVGVRPNVALAQRAGVRLGESGAIAVDTQQRTSLPQVFAAGDCAETIQLVTGKPTWVPLGTTANKQGKVAGANATGAHEQFRGIVGTAAFKVFDIEVARTGLSARDVEREGYDALLSLSEHKSRAGSFPGGTPVSTALFVERGSGRLLGAQMAGEDAGKRINVLATALAARMTVDDLQGLDLAYAPPIAPVYDPILVAASVARKQLARD
jgi:NADPH-dependent 2,4-dienoyl-CoA reductase/sulfur reductase-like enzyme